MPPQPPALHGKVQGGQQPIVGAQVYLYGAGTTGTRDTGYGANAASLLAAPGYVITGGDGTFTLTGKYDRNACQSSHDLVYVIAEGGQWGGAANNPATVLMSAVGDCASLSADTFVSVNEVTTVASVYALQQFMNATAGNYNVGASSTNVTGLKNAFLTVANLMSSTNGTALAATPNSNGKVPQAEIDTLANILSACVSSAGGSSACDSLFSDARPPGGTAPADTLHAMLNIARNPGNNVNALYDSAAPTLPFQPILAAAPNDWTIAVVYTGGGLNRPNYVAVDASGNLWVSDENSDSVSEFNALGVSLQGGGIKIATEEPSMPTGLAIDPSGNIWVTGFGSPGMAKLNGSGSYLSTATWNCSANSIAIGGSGDVYGASTGSNQLCKYSSGGTASVVQWGGFGSGIAVGGLGNVWVASDFSPVTIGEFSSSLSMAPAEPFAGWSDPEADTVAVAVDARGNVWAPNWEGIPLVTELSSSGLVLSGSGYPIADDAFSIAVDGDSTVWTANVNGTLSHLAQSGAALSPSTGYVASGIGVQNSIAVDASGNIWTVDVNNNYLVEWLGVAVPVATPMVQNLVNNPATIGQRP